MKTYLTIALLVNLTFYAQSFDCGVADEPLQYELHRRELLQQLNSHQRNETTEPINFVPIKAHLFGKNDNTGFENLNSLNNELAKLNAAFRNANIQFYFSGTTFSHYALSSFYYAQATGQEQDEFHITNGATNAANVYFSQNINYYGAVGAGLAFVGVTNQVTNRIWLQNNTSGTTHEFGHYFMLYHTFNNSTSSFINTRELVTRNFTPPSPVLPANCYNAGDYVCDTQSDPLHNGDATVSNCHYSGTVTDANSDFFHPDLNNFMDYYNCGPDVFTIEQYNRLKDGYTLASNPANNFTLDAPETVQNPPSNLLANSSDPDYNYIHLTWTDNSKLETGYIIEQSLSTLGPFVPIAGVQADTVSFNYYSAEPGNLYYFRIKPSNSKSNYSNVSNGITAATLCGNANGQTCELNPNPNDAAYRIESFTLSRANEVLISNLNSGCAVNGLANYYNSFQANVSANQVLNFNVKSKTGLFSSVYYILVKLYADWNRDNDFLDANELIYSSSTAMPAEDSGSFTIPANVTNGPVRLRVILTAAAAIDSPCEVTFGEMEDYKLFINSLANQQFAKQETVVVYPNPSHDYIKIKIPNNIQIDKLIITDLTGKVIRKLTKDVKPINIEDFAAGLYIIRIFSNENKYVAKFVKN